MKLIPTTDPKILLRRQKQREIAKTEHRKNYVKDYDQFRQRDPKIKAKKAITMQQVRARKRQTEAGRLAFARKNREYQLRTKYGIEFLQVISLWELQNRSCAICKLPLEIETGHISTIDHCHMTNKVRGILCRLCNVGLGAFKDDALRLRCAAEYLERN